MFVFRSSLKKGKTRNIDFQTEEFPIKTLYLKTKHGKTRKKDLIEKKRSRTVIHLRQRKKKQTINETPRRESLEQLYFDIKYELL